jgi:uncharacterized protein (DUF1697 family)
MSKYITFLRAINVGGHNIKMDDLRQLFESLGCANVETFIASGNVIFEEKAGEVKILEEKIETCLYKAFGFETAAFIRSDGEVARIVKYKPFPQSQLDTATTLNIGFLNDPLDDTATRKLTSLQTDIDDLRFNEREIYWLCQKKQSDSKVSNAVIEKALGVKSTLRGVTTIKKIAEKYCQATSIR